MDNRKQKQSWIYRLDIFSLTYNFNLEGNEKITSDLGLFFSAAYLKIVIGLFFGFGVDLYLRKTPFISFNNKITPFEEETKLKKSTIDLMFFWSLGTAWTSRSWIR